MKSTLAKLKDLKFKGKKLPWVSACVDEYVETLRQTRPDLARKLEKIPYARLNGSPHATPKTADPFHASVALRRGEDFKGSGLSLHVYPDGRVVPSKQDFPVIQTRPATAEELGVDAQWLDEKFVSEWVASNRITATPNLSKGKGKDKGIMVELRKKSSKKKDVAASSSNYAGNSEDARGYHMDPDSGTFYRYTEDGLLIYLDMETQREYFVDDKGQTVWV
ncbi:hypothetical protein ACRALDRAFT_1065993 [Sodiomyces alcalophilus JCM 7366]|uniref:uncharacterized protein n=1 Tax=Sodiomyces alcalophilus JCM 7366 TaxID=591952 RepID=UPI0039B5176F